MLRSIATHMKNLPGKKWFIWVPLLFILDQWSKWWVVHHISFGEIQPLVPGLQLTMAHNYGIAFSLLNQQVTLVQIALIIFVIGICGFMGVWLLKTPTQDKWTGIALTLILGGALGNLSDRLFYGYVVDFIDCYFRDWHWYTFNLADSFITIGAIMMIKTILFTPGDDKKQAGA